MHFKIIVTILVRAAQSLGEPCAEVSASWAAQATAPFTRDHRAQVPARLAIDCLMSVPVDVEGDIKEIEELKNFLQFQSTLSYLKEGHYADIPEEVHNQPLDLLSRLDDVAESIRNGTFKDEFAVQLAIHNLFRQSGDFHLRFRPDMLEIFLFVRPESKLVSLSEDGVALPQLYLLSDLERDTKISYSALKTINGEDASQYLERLWTHNVYHDADARYNSFFPNPAAQALDMDSGGQFYLTQGLYDGPTTEFKFVSGSHVVRENVAMIREFVNFSGVRDGPSFFAKFCQGKMGRQVRETRIEPSKRSNTNTSSTSFPMPKGYPQPLISQSGLAIQGYHLNSTKYHDVAVLAVPSFQPIAAAKDGRSGKITGFLEAQNVVKEFIAQSARDMRTKLIVDLRGNSGGTIDMAFELFKQLFPGIEPFGASRSRAHEAFRLYSSSVADLVNNRIPTVVNPQLYTDIAGSTANVVANLLNVQGTRFKDFKTYYGPYTANKDDFTAAQRYNFSNHIGGHPLAPYVNLSGYDEHSSARPLRLDPPFRPENIVILQDGFCGSACAMFAQLMGEQGHVQTIAVGGRPRNAPMQGIGGTKGAQLLTFDSIIRHMRTTEEITRLMYGPQSARGLVQTTAVGKLLNTSQLYLRSAHSNPDERLNGAVNSLDNLRQGDRSNTPLEFVYEAADCRLFYTKESFFNPVRLWEMAAAVKWGNGDGDGDRIVACIDGSMGHATAVGVKRDVPFNTQKRMTWDDRMQFWGMVLIVGTACFMLLSVVVQQDWRLRWR